MSFRCWQQQSIAGCWENVGDRFTEELVIVGGVSVSADIYLENKHVFNRHKWQPNGWPWLDPKADVQAHTLAIEGNQGTLDDSYSERGEDWEEQLVQRERELIRIAEMEARVMARRKSLGLDQEELAEVAA